jgi:hypothetical protein
MIHVYKLKQLSLDVKCDTISGDEPVEMTCVILNFLKFHFLQKLGVINIF